MKLKFNRYSIPIMLVSDSPELLTGLGRVGRDLAQLLCSMPEFRVAYLGMGGCGRSKFQWTSYQFPDNGQFGSDYLPTVWRDFAGSEPGIVMSLWDLSRMLWFVQSTAGPGVSEANARFLGAGRTFEKWGYVPVDSTGPSEIMLPAEQHFVARGYDRLLAASSWGAGVLSQSVEGTTYIPHGIWIDRFHPRPDARKLVGWSDEMVIVGVNMTNQARKDWAVAFETASLLKQEYGSRFRLWAHTDVLIRYWNMYALAADYGVQDCIQFTEYANDDQLSLYYSACDATMLPSAGEGFGFPIAESMACGTPCVVTDYAAGPCLVPPECTVPPVAFRVDTMHDVRRAVLSGYGFASRIKQQIEQRRDDPRGTVERMCGLVEHLSWPKLQHVWKRWFMEGIR